MESEWTGVLAAYEAHCSDRTAASTLRIRMGRLHRFAADIGSAPDGVSRERFESWAAALPCSIATAGEYVCAVRAFYRWARGAGIVTESPVPSAEPVRQGYTSDARWGDAVAAFERSQIAAGIAPGTRRRRLQHVRRFAAAIGLDPWHVQPEDYGAWLAQIQGGYTAAAARDSLRAFYRWAASAGRVSIDPSAEPSRRALSLPIPERWEPELRAWRRWLIASGTATTTVELRAAHLAAFARAHTSAEPYAISTDDVFDYMAGKRWARETRRGHRASLRSFYRWARETGRTAADPTELMPRVKVGDPVIRPATDDEYAAALAAATDPRWRLALRMAYELGMRCAEVAQTHTSDMQQDSTGGVWLTVHGKGGKRRRVPVPPNLAALLSREESGYVFPGQDGGHLSPHYLGKRISATLPRGVTMHALRHAFATRTYNVNRDVFTVQRLLGHASAGTTQRYVQVTDASMRELVEAVAW